MSAQMSEVSLLGIGTVFSVPKGDMRGLEERSND